MCFVLFKVLLSTDVVKEEVFVGSGFGPDFIMYINYNIFCFSNLVFHVFYVAIVPLNSSNKSKITFK